jgi:hypothetical protein
LSSDKLLDPLITQVTKNETSNKSKSDGDSDDDDEVIPSTYSIKAGPFIQVPITAPTSIRSSTHSKRHIKQRKSVGNNVRQRRIELVLVEQRQ